MTDSTNERLNDPIRFESIKFAAITGVCGGIGAALMRGLLRKGYQVIGVDIDRKKLDEFQRTYGERFHPFEADLSQRSLRKAVCEEIRQIHGVPRIWINNAGVAHIDAFLDTEEAVFDRVLELNLNATIDLTRFWLREMKAVSRGTLVNIASCAGHIAAPHLSAYSVSKHGVVGLTESIQQELKFEHSKVKMVLVSPGFVNTDIIKLGQEKGFPPILSFIPESPEACAQEIIEGVLRGRAFIAPTFNGKLLLGMNRLSPEICKASSHLLIAPQLKSLFGFLD
ncbi:MAG TPA: SDR family oxidoreductase [Candidatus Obscuribacterales bacterium]